MSARHYHKRYHSDALAGMMGLTLEERGAYQTLLDLIYDRAGPLPDNERLLAGYMGCSVRKWRSLRNSLISQRKIVITVHGEITNPRAELEIENALKTSRKHAENGSSGGRKNAERAKYSNENNESDEAPLKPGSSHTRYQIPERKKDSSEQSNPRERPDADRHASDPDFENRVRALAKVIGLTRPPSQIDREQLRVWIRDGLDFELHVVEGALPVAAREHGKGKAVSGFRYLDGAVREYAAEWHAERDRFRAVAGAKA